MRLKRRYSLSSKLIMLFIGMALLFLILGGNGLKYSLKQHFENNVRPHIAQYLEYVRQDIGSPPNRERAQQLADKLNIEISIVDNAGVWSSHNRTINIAQLDIRHRFIENETQYTMGEIQDRDYLIVDLENAKLLFHVPHIRQERQGLKGFIPLLIILTILFALYYAIRYLFAPILTIQTGVKRIGAGDLTYRLNIQRHDELGLLADDVNIMAEDIQKMLDAKRQLLLAISHELRSPLTRAKVATELLENEQYQQQIKLDLDTMEELIAEIIETEKLNSRHQILEKQTQDLRNVIQDTINSHFKDRAIQLDLPATTLSANIDITRIKLLLKNLIDNALLHSRDKATNIEVSAHPQNGHIIVTVTDHGDGIEAEHIPHLTEPFYRADPARQRETGGYGLGLYLCKAITEAHAGQLIIASKLGQGTTITIKLPNN